MKEIALQTGVSVSTVSLVLNGRDNGRIKPAIAQRVRKVAHQMGYEPNALARSLRTSKTRMIGFISIEVATTPYAGGIITGAQDALSALGYMLLTVSGENTSTIESQIASLKSYGVDGFLYSTMSNRLVRIPDSLSEYPLVLADTTDIDNRFPAIEPNEFRIGYDATTRLIEAGYTDIAYVGCDEPTLAQQGRLQGYQQSLYDHGRTVHSNLICNVNKNESALQAVDTLFEKQQPDGFFCFNDARAWYVYECAARRNLSIGNDIGVVGVDNHQIIAQTLVPQLTTIELPHYEMGFWAANKLISIIENRSINESNWPRTTAVMPLLNSEHPAKIHCTLLEKDSVR